MTGEPSQNVTSSRSVMTNVVGSTNSAVSAMPGSIEKSGWSDRRLSHRLGMMRLAFLSFLLFGTLATAKQTVILRGAIDEKDVRDGKAYIDTHRIPVLTGDFIDAATALDQGLVNRVVPADALDAEIEKLVQSILQKPRVAVAMGKALVHQQRELGLDAAYQLAGQAMAVNMMEEAAQEGARAFAEKRQPAWKRGS